MTNEAKFYSLVAVMRERNERYEAAVRAGDLRERAGEVVLWYKGLPLPKPAVLSERASFLEWLSCWSEKEQSAVRGGLVPLLRSAPELGAGTSPDAQEWRRYHSEFIGVAAKVIANCES